MMKSYKKGFTLIELLVVIAIIGILAAVVLASLGTARSKGADAAVKSGLDGLRSAMELQATNNSNSYSGACASAGPLAVLQGTATSSTIAAGAAPVTLVTTAGAYNRVTCHDGVTSWAAEAPLSASITGTPAMWCVDSAGNAKQEAAVMIASAVACL